MKVIQYSGHCISSGEDREWVGSTCEYFFIEIDFEMINRTNLVHLNLSVVISPE